MGKGTPHAQLLGYEKPRIIIIAPPEEKQPPRKNKPKLKSTGNGETRETCQPGNATLIDQCNRRKQKTKQHEQQQNEIEEQEEESWK